MKNDNTIKLLEILRQKCLEHNLKLTPQRIAIYEEISNKNNHPSADKVFRKVRQKFSSISFDTVNRTLITFSAIGLLKIVEGYGDPKRFDPNLKQHHHFRCLKCNEITDIYNDYYNNIAVPEELAGQFHIVNKKVVLEGVCMKCVSGS
jgi:Fur family transcriptional regulator, peroxide stress response regulator